MPKSQFFAIFPSPLLSLLWFTLLAFGAGCSGPIGTTQPSESAAQKILEDRIAQQSKGQIKLVSFKKTNATSDPNLYRMEFDAQIEFLSNGSWSRGAPSDSSVKFEFDPNAMGNDVTAQMMGNVLGTKNVHRGEREVIKDSITFQKTENGWREFN